MNPDVHLEQILAEGAAAALPDAAQPFAIGDHISIVETVSESGSGLVILGQPVTQRHLILLTKALEELIKMSYEEFVDADTNTEGDSDAA